MQEELQIEQNPDKASLAEMSLDEIRELTRSYPYFVPAQVMLAARLRQVGDEAGFRKQLSKAAVYLPDPFLLNQALEKLRQVYSSSENGQDQPGSSRELDVDSSPGLDVGSTDESLVSNIGLEKPLLAETERNEAIPGTAEQGPTSEFLPANPEEISPPPEKEETVVEQKAAENKQTLPGGDQELRRPTPPVDELDTLIRPLYTEDYFASLGIKLPDNVDDTKKPTSAQLRSFTDWLRVMKRPKGAMGPEGSHVVDKDRMSSIYNVDEENSISTAVEKMALQSIQPGEEVMTEAMAEIRIQQGQPEKAIAIYEKLSLLNPRKSGYFAGKIASIQQSS